MIDESVNVWFRAICSELKVHPIPNLNEPKDRNGRQEVYDVIVEYCQRLRAKAFAEIEAAINATNQTGIVARRPERILEELHEKYKSVDETQIALFRHFNLLGPVER